MASRKKGKSSPAGQRDVLAKRHEEQEAIAARYAESICQSIEGIAPYVQYGASCKLIGFSGHNHQIDVAVFGPNDLIIIECKCGKEESKKRSIGVDMVLQFFGRLYDIRQHLIYKGNFLKIHGIMVASKPFSCGAKKIAQRYGVDLQPSNSIEYFALRYKNLVVAHPAPLPMGSKIPTPSISVAQSQ